MALTAPVLTGPAGWSANHVRHGSNDELKTRRE